MPVPLDPPAPASHRGRDEVPQQEPADPPGGAAAAGSADLNETIPDAWKPFVRTTAITSTIIGGKRSKSSGRTTITLDGGTECYTTDHELAQAAIAYKESRTPVTITMTEGHEIVTLSEATDAAF